MQVNLFTSPKYANLQSKLDANGQSELARKVTDYQGVLNGVLRDGKITPSEALNKVLPLFSDAHALETPALREGLMALLADTMGNVSRSGEVAQLTGVVGRLEQLATGDFQKLHGELKSQARVDVFATAEAQRSGAAKMGWAAFEPAPQVTLGRVRTEGGEVFVGDARITDPTLKAMLGQVPMAEVELPGERKRVGDGWVYDAAPDKIRFPKLTPAPLHIGTFNMENLSRSAGKMEAPPRGFTGAGPGGMNGMHTKLLIGDLIGESHFAAGTGAVEPGARIRLPHERQFVSGRIDVNAGRYGVHTKEEGFLEADGTLSRVLNRLPRGLEGTFLGVGPDAKGTLAAKGEEFQWELPAPNSHRFVGEIVGTSADPVLRTWKGDTLKLSDHMPLNFSARYVDTVVAIDERKGLVAREDATAPTAFKLLTPAELKALLDHL